MHTSNLPYIIQHILGDKSIGSNKFDLHLTSTPLLCKVCDIIKMMHLHSNRVISETAQANFVKDIYKAHSRNVKCMTLFSFPFSFVRKCLSCEYFQLFIYNAHLLKLDPNVSDYTQRYNKKVHTVDSDITTEIFVISC